MGESLALHANPWGVSFANDLQPTDNEQQIAWRGIPSDSPLLSKAQSSVRPCLDLTHPETLALQPVPEFAEEARTGKKQQPKSRVAAPVFTKALPESLQDPVPAIALLSKTNQRPRRNPYAVPLAVVIGLLVLLLVVGGGIFGYLKYSQKQEVERLKAEIALILPNSPPLENFHSKDDLLSIKAFGEYLERRDTNNAREKLRGFPLGNADWNGLRDFCEEKLAKQELGQIYSKTFEDTSPENISRMRKLIESLNPTDQALWANAIIALDFIKKTSDKPLEIKNIQLPNDFENKDVSDKIIAKINPLNDEIQKRNIQSSIKQSIDDSNSLEPHSKELLAKTNKEKVSTDSNSNTQIIYIIDNITDKKTLIPESHQGWSELISEQISWNQLQSNSSVESKIWGGKSNFAQFPASDIESIQFKVFKNNLQHDKIVSHTVLNRRSTNLKNNELSKTDIKALEKACNDYKQICRVENNKLFLNNQFHEFLKSLFKRKDVRYQIAWSLKYKDNFFESLNSTKKIIDINLDEIFITFGDMNFLIENEESQIFNILETKTKSKKELNDKIKLLKEDLSKSFPFSGEKFRDWDEFVKATKDKIDSAKNAKVDVRDFQEAFLHNGARKIDDFLNKYKEINDKSQFSASLLRVDDDLKKWFFFDEETWSEKSRENFKNQFNKDLFAKLNNEISSLEIKREDMEKDKTLGERRNLLASRKSPQKATLNFYLEESDTEPFLTTEVTIPFPADSPTVVTTPPSTPVP
jgi:hypothetical protein